MASNYPEGIDHFDVPSIPTVTPLSSSGDSLRNHVESHRDLGDAIVALQTHAAKKTYVDTELSKKATLVGGAVPISAGGTGATTAAGARDALGVPRIYVSETAPTGAPEGSLWFEIV